MHRQPCFIALATGLVVAALSLVAEAQPAGKILVAAPTGDAPVDKAVDTDISEIAQKLSQASVDLKTLVLGQLSCKDTGNTTADCYLIPAVRGPHVFEGGHGAHEWNKQGRLRVFVTLSWGEYDGRHPEIPLRQCDYKYLETGSDNAGSVSGVCTLVLEKGRLYRFNVAGRNENAKSEWLRRSVRAL